MNKNRLEAFSDGVIAILITIMVLELKVPETADLHALVEVWPHFLSYVLSFVYLAIYWNNHHHMLHTADKVDGGILWANNHLLFWLSLIPFSTAWSGESGFAQWPVIIYATVLLCCALAYFVLERTIIHSQGAHSRLAAAVGKDWKGKLSPVLYVIAIVSGFFSPAVCFFLLTVVALIWIVPDQRIERREAHKRDAQQ